MNSLLFALLAITVFLLSLVSAAPQRSLAKYDYDQYDDMDVFVDKIPKRKLRRSVKTEDLSSLKRDSFELTQQGIDDFYADHGISVDAIPIVKQQHQKKAAGHRHRKPHGHLARKRKFFDQERFFH